MAFMGVFENCFIPYNLVFKGIEKLKAVRPKNYKWKGRTPEEEIIVTERGQDQEEIEGYLISTPFSMASFSTSSL